MKNRNIPKYIGPEKSNTSNKMTKDEIKNRFNNETASLYSQRDPSWLPEFNFSFTLIQKVIKNYINKNSKIADLGAGTGNLSRTILEAYPDVQIDLIDFSENMLNEVINVLSEFKGKYKTITADIFNYELNNSTYNAIISSFAIHHARGENIYEKIYKNIYNALTETGIFICCDVIEGGNKDLSSINEADWSIFLENQGFEKDKIDQILSNYHREDSPLSLGNHLKLLKDVGFKTVDVLWKKYNFGIYLGIK
jgi:tRNA (cmo5U34)-methyltransferase